MKDKIANKQSWKNIKMPNESINLKLEINLSEQELELLKKGHIPEVMEDHWFMYFEDNKLYIHRSWTGFCIYIVSVNENGNIEKVQVNRNKEQYNNVDDEQDKYEIAHLIYNMIGRKDKAERMLEKKIKLSQKEDKLRNSEEMFPNFEEMNDRDESNNNSKVKDYMNKFIDDYKEEDLTELDKEFNKYCELYQNKFGKHAYIAEPNGTKEQTINAIKVCIEKNEDILDEILYPNQNINEQTNNNISLTEKNKGIFKKIINAIKNIFKKN